MGASSARTLADGRWSVLARSPLGTRYQPTLVWDGRELLELGGSAGGRLGGAPSDSGAAYSPVTRRWHRVAAAPAMVEPDNAAAVWTGKQVFILGGPSVPGEKATHVAGLYDPASDRWTLTSRAPVGPLPLDGSAVWSGSRVIVAGMTRGKPKLQVASYDPATNVWARLHPPINPQHRPMTVAIVATNDGVLLWSLWARSEPLASSERGAARDSGVDVFRLSATGVWTNVTGTWPQNTSVGTPVFTGSKILLAPAQIWCGTCSPPLLPDANGYVVNPKTLARTAIPHGPLDGIGPQIIWTGAAIISLDNGGEITGPHIRVLPGDIAIWNPCTRKWTRGPRAPQAVSDIPAVWNGKRLYVLAHHGILLAYGH